MSSLRATAALFCLVLACSLGPRPGCAGVWMDTSDVESFEYVQVGATEEEAVRLACIRGVKATVGMLLLGDFSLQGRDLLESYIQKNYQRFVASYTIRETRAERDGVGIKIRVQTFPEQLARDLREKRFLYLPNRTPRFLVLISEMENRRATNEGRLAASVRAALQQEGGTPVETAFEFDLGGADLLEDYAAYQQAVEAASRAGADVLVLGMGYSHPVDSKEVLFSQVFTNETHLRVAFIKADDGRLLGRGDFIERGSDTSQESAQTQAIQAAAQAAVRQLYPPGRELLENVVNESASFTLMVTDVQPDELQTVLRHLETHLAGGTRGELRTYYGNVATVTLRTPRDFSALERAVVDFKAFDVRIKDRQGARVVLSCKH